MAAALDPRADGADERRRPYPVWGRGDVASLRAELATLRAEVAAMRAELANQARPDAPERLLSVREAAEVLGVGRTALYGQIQSGRLRSIKVGRRRLVASSAIAAYETGE